MTAANRPTLAQLNTTPSTRDWGKYTVRREWAVGSQSQRYGSSPKTHLLRIEVVIEDRDPQPRTYRVGQTFAAAAVCNTNGQHTGRAYPDTDTDRITCERCLRRLDGMVVA